MTAWRAARKPKSASLWRVRTRALAIGLALVLPASAAAAPPKLRVKSSKTVVTATQGSYCWVEEGGGLCADMAYPLPTQGTVPWRARAPVVFGTSAPVDTLDPCLSRVEGGSERPLGVCLKVERGADGKFRGRLPKNLRGANRLSIFVTAPQGDAHYSAAIR